MKEPRDDIFWRTAGSGGRAKTRGRKGKDTANSHGDITAIDPIGEPLIDLLTLELKRGYSKHTLHDLLDKPPKAAVQEYESWILQAEEGHCQAGSYSWLIIAQRDRRLPLVILPHSLFIALNIDVPGLYRAEDCIYPHTTIRLSDRMLNPLEVFHLEDFLERTSPEQVKKLSRET